MVSKQPKKFLSRRKFAATFSGAVLAGLAGCSGGNGGGNGGEDGGEATATATATDTPEPTATATATPTSTPTEEADATITVGPGGSLEFDPETTAISQGDTVEFVFDSGGHNVSGHPDAHPKVSLPEGAEPFASYDISGDDINHISLNKAGSTYRHTFETTGEYTYVCVPHAASGMIGHLTVR
ncbi:plastocyanin/azurin family copper-binding protein [Haloplanus aerogenes]|uniref:Halocyanin n=1 Tax=Haloplanus aerogenes TaxID=660522 RepID=A0A3M0CWS1_9EURY|nr:plastocyanin/azurin family copper-binding protein [Haloplanus aerogenes]AZH26745.1 halocyanin [Haloplanus aerogenes]RMB12990.1 plastocyanin [Haloplanus aerogenes]